MNEIDVSIIGLPFVAGLLVILTHVPLGQRVLERGIIFIDLAVAQMAALGVVIVELLGWSHHMWAVQATALATALLGALLLYGCEVRWPSLQEALIGSAFVLAASGAILLLAHHPHGAQQVETLLSGQILWVTTDRLWPVAWLSAGILLLWFVPWWRARRVKFYILFAIAVTASVQLVGIYLVFASLILPALATVGVTGHRLGIGYGLGALGYLSGLAVSSWWDLPGGPTIVWMLALCAFLFGVGRGILARNTST